MFEQGRLAYTALACVVYGAFRAISFSPRFRPGYQQWLSTTPWMPQKPLPFGSIHLVWQDVLLLGLLYLYVHYIPQAFTVVAASFLGTYLGLLCISFFLTGVWRYGYLLAAVLGAVVLFAEEPRWAIALLLGCYVIAYGGIRAMLSRFFSNFFEFGHVLPLQFHDWAEAQKGKSLGWHFDQLASRAEIAGIQLHHRILFPLLAAWFYFVILIHFQGKESPSLFLMFYSVPCFLSVIIRLYKYCSCYWSPVNLRGRIYPGPLIIPRYDKVFLAPLALVAFTVGTPLVLRMLGAGIVLSFALALGVVLSLAMNAKPTLRNWVLTGGHRIVVFPQKTIPRQTALFSRESIERGR